MSAHSKNPSRIRSGSFLAALSLLALLCAGLVVSWHLLTFRSPDDPAGDHVRSRSEATAPLTKPPPPPNDYVGSAACADCHGDIYRTYYRSHPMGGSLDVVPGERPVEDYTSNTTFTVANHIYSVEKTDKGVFHHEIRLDTDGEVIYDQAVPVHYAIGSGKRGRSYLIDRGEVAFLSPISWYSEGRRWDLSPGYRPGSHKRFERRATDQCLQCHAGRLNPVPETVDRYLEPPFLEPGIGCERCHGPGGRHVDFHLAAANGGPDPIVNPASLDPPLRDSVCNQCHLQGLLALPRYGRTNRDFRPGMHINEVWTVFVQGPRVAADGTTEAVSHVQQMHTSRCFQATAGRLGCISCHDPHRVPQASSRAEFYRSRCLQCHQQPRQGCALPLEVRDREPARNSCIHCHMPRLTASDIPHTTQTDHRIPRRPGTAPATDHEASPVVFDADTFPIPDIEIRRARGIVLAMGLLETGNPDDARRTQELLRSVVEAAPDDVESLHSLALACAVQGRSNRALELWTRALRVDPENEQVLRFLAEFHRRGNRPRAVVEFVERLLSINPWHADVYHLHAGALAMLGRFPEALRSAGRAAQLDPSQAQHHEILARLLHDLGDRAAAANVRRTARRLREQ